MTDNNDSGFYCDICDTTVMCDGCTELMASLRAHTSKEADDDD